MDETQNTITGETLAVEQHAVVALQIEDTDVAGLVTVSLRGSLGNLAVGNRLLRDGKSGITGSLGILVVLPIGLKLKRVVGKSRWGDKGEEQQKAAHAHTRPKNSAAIATQ